MRPAIVTAVALAALVAGCNDNTRTPTSMPATTARLPIGGDVPTATTVVPTTTPPVLTTAAEPAPKSAYYANCDQVRAAGAAPLHRGEPGYRKELDRDGDGTACEVK